MTTLAPRDAKELQQAVEWALNEGVTLDVRGGGSKIALGRPMTCDQVLDLSSLSGIVDYAPEELVVTLRAGTPLREVEALLAQRNQMLAFEPPDLGPLLGHEPVQGTLGGAVMGNLAGPRRVGEGGAPPFEARLRDLTEPPATSGARMEELGTLDSRALWREVRDGAPLDTGPEDVFCRISCPPTEGPAIVARIKAQRATAKLLYD